jgi:putative peptidoglycan lipid II flippase
VLNLILINYIAHVGIALATALASWLNAALLGIVLCRRGHHAVDTRLKARTLRILAASAGMAGGLWFAMRGLDGALAGPPAERIAALTALVIGGLVLYGVLAVALGAARPADLRQLLRRDRAGSG